ncbi:MAG TPA: outer membrane beta-barrel protein [Methylocella sp.]|nr:outer membrane beta-barrel protein [Methylocella sp.]
MRNLFLASVGVIALTGSAALAADLPSRAPPPAYIPPAPIFTWTGIYVGGQVGYAWASGANRVSGIDPVTGIAFDSSIGQNPNGVIGGANVGYNYEIPQWNWFTSSGVVIGVEGSVDGTSLTNTAGLVFPDGTALTAHTSADIQGRIVGRLGLAWDRLLIFAAGGVAFGGFNTDFSIFGPAFVTPAGVPFGAFGGTSSFSQTRVGWTVGGGIQYAITNNWSVRADYRYTDWGSINNALFGGDAFALAFPGFGFNGNRHIQQNQVQVGFDYKFDLFNPPPVVAKY